MFSSRQGEETAIGQLTKKPEFLLKARLKMLEVWKVASLITTAM